MAGERIISYVDPATYNAEAIIRGEQQLMTNRFPFTAEQRARWALMHERYTQGVKYNR